jgi:hypothetical protein
MTTTEGNEMNTTTRPGFTARADRLHAACMGANHHDSARMGNCDGCGFPVAKTDNGRILDVFLSARGGSTIACWSHGHVCNPEIATAYTASRAAKIDAGEIIKGAQVVVVKGRKVAHGTTGIVTWMGTDNYGKPRIGFRTADGEMIFTATSNVTVVI